MKTKKFRYLMALLIIALFSTLSISCFDDSKSNGQAPFAGIWADSSTGFKLTINNDNTFTIYDPGNTPPYTRGTFTYTSETITFTVTEGSTDGKTWTSFSKVWELSYTLGGNDLTLEDKDGKTMGFAKISPLEGTWINPNISSTDAFEVVAFVFNGDEFIWKIFDDQGFLWFDKGTFTYDPTRIKVYFTHASYDGGVTWHQLSARPSGASGAPHALYYGDTETLPYRLLDDDTLSLSRWNNTFTRLDTSISFDYPAPFEGTWECSTYTDDYFEQVIFVFDGNEFIRWQYNKQRGWAVDKGTFTYDSIIINVHFTHYSSDNGTTWQPWLGPYEDPLVVYGIRSYKLLDSDTLMLNIDTFIRKP